MAKVSQRIFIFFIPLLFIIIYFQVFVADYAYLDEIHQLWNNQDQSNYQQFLGQGRWLTGLIIQKAYSSITTIEELKYLRIFSLAGWIATTILWFSIVKTWSSYFNWDWQMPLLTNLFFICSASVGIYIGWASCIEVWLALALGIISAHSGFLFLNSSSSTLVLKITRLFVSVLTGIACLFCYQSCFAIFLVPFIFYFKSHYPAIGTRLLLKGVSFYLLMYVLYYFLMQMSLHAVAAEASNRAALSNNFGKKIAFFFSGPLPSAFSLNVLYRAGSLVNQVWQYLVLATWVLSIVTFYKNLPVLRKLLMIPIYLLLLALLYLPSLASNESFASYRSLFVVNLVVFVLVVDGLISLSRRKKIRPLIYAVSALLLVGTGYYNFNYQFISPLKHEYAAISQAANLQIQRTTEKVDFIRADRQLFKKVFALRSYKDEYGAPSTSRDWVPEPLLKQLLFEKTRERALSQQLRIIQYNDRLSYDQLPDSRDSTIPLIDMNDLLIKGN